jgi:hypothetical protein
MFRTASFASIFQNEADNNDAAQFMKVISIWQPYATLVVEGFKFFETRTWAPPKSVIGQRIGIASTKNVVPAQRAEFNSENFQFFYEDLGLPALEELPMGYLLGTVLLDSYEVITDDFLDDITAEEQAYGWYKLGGYAWRLKKPEKLAHPIPIRGAQGLYEWKGFDNGAQAEGQNNGDQARSQDRRSHLSLC